MVVVIVISVDNIFMLGPGGTVLRFLAKALGGLECGTFSYKVPFSFFPAPPMVTRMEGSPRDFAAFESGSVVRSLQRALLRVIRERPP